MYKLLKYSVVKFPHYQMDDILIQLQNNNRHQCYSLINLFFRKNHFVSPLMVFDNQRYSLIHQPHVDKTTISLKFLLYDLCLAAFSYLLFWKENDLYQND